MIPLDKEYTTTEAAEGGQYELPPPGGYILQCIEASDKPSNAGKAMVTLSFDIAEGEYQGAFAKYPKKFFQLVNGEHLAYFKGMLKAFEESNSAQAMAGVVKDLQFDSSKLVKRLVGASIREAEYKDKTTGEIKVGMEIHFLCPVKQVPDIKPAGIKKFKAGTAASSPSGPRSAPPQTDDDLPW